MSTVVSFIQPPTPQEALQHERQWVYDELLRTMPMVNAVERMPWLIKELHRVEPWLERPSALGRKVIAGNLYRLIHLPPPDGIRSDYATVERLIRHDPEALALWTEMTKGQQGERTDLVNNVNEVASLPGRPQGNSREAALRRLAKEASAGNEAAVQMREAVLAGEKSPHGALVELGLRRRAITIPADVEGAAAALRRHFTPSQLSRLAAFLVDDE